MYTIHNVRTLIRESGQIFENFSAKGCILGQFFVKIILEGWH